MLLDLLENLAGSLGRSVLPDGEIEILWTVFCLERAERSPGVYRP